MKHSQLASGQSFPLNLSGYHEASRWKEGVLTGSMINPVQQHIQLV
jgi:hypothetical protein